MKEFLKIMLMVLTGEFPEAATPPPPRRKNGPKIPLADMRDPEELFNGCVIAAMKGAGKTNLIKKLVNSVIDLGRPVYLIDTGDKWAEHVRRVRPKTLVRRVSPHTVGGLKIHWAKTVNTPARIQAFTGKIVGNEKSESKNPYFPTNAQLVMMAAIEMLIIFLGDKWTLRDFIILATNRKLFVALLDHPKVKGRVRDPQDQFAHNDSARDVMGTVVSHLLPLMVYAALEEHAPAKVGLFDAIDEGGVTIFEWSDNFAEANSKMLSLAAELVMDELLSRQAENLVLWCLDEIRSLAQIDAIANVATRGRRSGIGFVWSMHIIEGLQDRYTKLRAMELADLMGIKIFLNLDGNATLAWAADSLGKCQHVVEVWKDGLDGKAGHWERSVRELHRVPPIELQILPYADPVADKVCGYVKDRFGVSYFDAKFLADCPMLTDPGPTLQPQDCQRLKRLTRDDMARWGVGVLTKEIKEALDLS